MKIAIIGYGGYIASYLNKRFKNMESVEHILKIGNVPNADISFELLDAERFNYSVLDDIDYVIFTAAISRPDKCANEYDFCWKVNVKGTKYFINKAIERGCKVIFFSSDAVYGPDCGIPFTEESQTNAITAYGKMKKTVEDEFLESAQFKAVRLSYVISGKDRFVSYCLKCLKNNERAEVFHPFYRNCTVVTDVVEAVTWLVENWNRFNLQFLNIAGDELVSRIRIADELNRYLNNYGKRLDYIIVTPEEGFFRNRHEITQMRSLYLDKFEIIKRDSFSLKFIKEMEDLKND